MAFDPKKVTSNFTYQDGYQTTLSSAITSSDLAIPLTALPTGSEGTLVIDAGTSSEEEIYFNSQGSGVVNCPSVSQGRGINGTTAVAHNSGATVKMLITKASLDVLKNLVGMSSSILSGWISAECETWTYASWTDNKGTITISGDVTSKYPIGTPIRLKQGGAYLYFYVYTTPTYSSPNTTLSLCGDSSALAGATNYLTNTTITDNYYSLGLASGHPVWFNYNPTIGATESMTWDNSVNSKYVYRLCGNMVKIKMYLQGTTGGTNSYGLTFTIPITPDDEEIVNGAISGRTGGGTINGSVEYSGSNHIFTFRKYDASNLGIGSNRGVYGEISYPIKITVL